MWGKVRSRLSDAGPRKIVGYAVLATVGGLLGSLLGPEQQAHATRVVNVRAAGTPVAPAADPFDAALEVARQYLSEPITIRAGKHEITMSRALVGARVDRHHLARLLRQARDPESSLSRVHAQVAPGQPVNLSMPVVLDTAAARKWLVRLKDRVDRDPVDARVNPRAQAVVPAQNGARLDLFSTYEALDEALARGADEVRATVVSVPPKRRASALSGIDMSRVLGEFETRYDRSYKAEDRTHNLKVAASAIDGFVLKPGQMFNFNQVVGPRNKIRGYRDAPVIANGEMADGMGGGTCQIASTLHAAAFFAGLPIVTRHPHTRPSFYIKLGLDAAVANDTLNLRFGNDLPFAAVIGMSVEDGVVRAEIRGARRTRRVTFDRRILTVVPYKQRFIKDSGLPAGMRVLSQRGTPGFRVLRVREISERAGKSRARQEMTRREMTDTYPPTVEIWRVGTGEAVPEGFELPENDTHPEYVVDEYLQVIQGPGIKGLRVKREPGRTGVHGWTSREDFTAGQ